MRWTLQNCHVLSWCDCATGGLVLALACLPGCTGDSAGAASDRSAPIAGNGGQAPSGGQAASGGASELGTAEILETRENSISRLTAPQFLNSAAALMGETAIAGAEEKLTLREAWTGPAYSNAGFNQATGKHDIQDFDGAATYIVEHVTDWPAFHARWGGCQELSCISTFLGRFVEAAFRRPPTAADIAAFQPILDAAQRAQLSYEETVQLVARAVLQSFEFLYLPRDEQLDDFQVAARLAYFVTDGPPDAELYAAAKGHQLTDPAVLEQQTDRLLSLSAGRFARAFARDYFELNVAFLRAGERETQRQLVASAMDSFAALVEERSTVSAVMTTESFVGNDATTGILGAPSSSSPSVGPTAAYPFFGLLTHPAVLLAISNEQTGSTISRGLAVSEQFLCVAPPPNPPPGIQAKQADFNLPDDATARAKAEARLTSPTCVGCHSRFEPFSFGLNHWTGDGHYDPDPRLNDAGPITTVLGTLQFQGYRELLQKLSTSAQYEACIGEHLIRYGLQHTEFGPEVREAVLAEARRANPSGLTFQSLIKALVKQPIFRHR